jgi:AcrR family transcriptional regulator
MDPARPSEAPVPAPGRGQYDRALSRAQRQTEQRDRLVQATAHAFATGPLTISRIVSAAGVGRNTFYEYFDDPEHALQLVEARALRALEHRALHELEAARTPLEKLRALARAWFTELEAEPLAFRVALREAEPARGVTLSAAGRLLSNILVRVIEQSRSAGMKTRPSALKIVAAVAAAEAFSRARLSDSEPRQYETELVEVMSRLLR